VDRSADMAWVRSARSGTEFQVHRYIAPIIKHVIDEIEAEGYLLHRPGQVRDDWSYVNRPIRGRSAPSNHSWGLAIDIDATQFPLGSRKRLPEWIVEKFREHGFEYGGNWRRRPDPMHFEFAGTPADARRIAAGLTTTDRPVAGEEDIMATAQELEAIVRKVVAEENSKTRTWIREELVRVVKSLVAEIRKR
jgi:hypothetical protein